METIHQAALTPEQLAAVAAGGGYAHCEDPQTHIVYHLLQQSDSTIDDDYVRRKLDEAYTDIEKNGLKPLDMAAIKQELNRRLASKDSSTN